MYLQSILSSCALVPLFGADAPAAPTAPAGGGAFSAVVMIFFVLIALFFIVVLPSKSRNKQEKKMLDALKINDKVLTTGGIIGTVNSIDREAGEVVLRVDDSTKIRFAIGAIYFVYNKEAAEKAAKEKAAAKEKKEQAKSSR